MHAALLAFLVAVPGTEPTCWPTEVAGWLHSGLHCPSPLTLWANLSFSTTAAFCTSIWCYHRQMCLLITEHEPPASLTGWERNSYLFHASQPKRNADLGRCCSLHPHLPFGKPFPPLSLLRTECLQSYFKIWLVVLPSLNVTVTRKKGLNLSNGSSPVLRPLWLAIQYICQARVTLWLWRTGTGGDEWGISAAAIPFL